MARGEVGRPRARLFPHVPAFEAPAGPYEWLNRSCLRRDGRATARQGADQRVRGALSDLGLVIPAGVRQHGEPGPRATGEARALGPGYFASRNSGMTTHDHTTRSALRHAQPARRPAARSDDGRAGGADLPDHVLRVRRHRARGCAVQPGTGRATSIRASPTRRWRCWRSASSALEGGVGAVATASGQAALHLIIATLMGAGGHIVASSRIYGGSHNMFMHTLPRFGITTTLVDPRDPGRLREGHHRQDAPAVRRDARQPRSGGAGHRGGRGRRAQARAAARRRFHLRHALSVPAHRARRRHRHAFRHQVPRRAWHRHRRHRRRRRPLRLGRRRASSRP